VIIEKEGYESQQIIVNSESEEGEIFIALDKAKPIDKTLADSGMDNNGSNENGISDSGSEDGFDDGAGIENVDEAFPSTIREGTVFQLSNIYYNFNDASIRPDAKIDLDALAAFLNKYPDVEIELASHTDSRGGTRYNRVLSQKRAENAVQYLVDRGVGVNRLRAVGYGESELRNRCSDGVNCSEVEHQYNRRTEVKITKMDQEINIRFVTDTSGPDTNPANSNETVVSDYGTSSPGNEGESNASNSNSTFQVIAGVFKNYDNAEGRYNKLQSYGYAPEIINAGETYTILVGYYYTLQEAQTVVQTLKNNYQIRSFVKR
jgi:outer membrane protein OmpA-like peptidoglycan-associated protein